MVNLSPRHTAPAVMSWNVARRLAALVVTTGLLLPAIHAAAIKHATTQNEISAGNDFDNSITAFTDVKSIESTNDVSGFEIRCYCNMPACLAASGGVRTCTTRLGCFSQLQPNLPNLDGTVTHSITTTTTTRMTTLIPEEFDVEAAIYGNDNALNGAYGCLDLLSINKTCDEVLKLMENEQSEFPFIMGTHSQSNDDVMSAYHCCEEDMCNDRSHVAASASNAEASLIAAFENSMDLKKDSNNTTTTTEEPGYQPIPVALVKEHKEFFVNVGNVAPDEFPKRIDDSSVNTTITALAFHIGFDEENTPVATPSEAVLNSTKSPDHSMFLAHETNSKDSSYNRHQRVDEIHHQSTSVDVIPSSGLLGWTGIPQWIEGVTGILAICGVVGVTVVALVAMKIVRRTDVFEHYKSVCSNPGQPCACNGGIGSRRSRQLTSSSTVYRNTTASIQPVLPPPNNNLYGLAYVDSTGNSTHVYTPIPVPL